MGPLFRGEAMKTWAQIQAFIDKHSLPYRITHWNLSMRGCLIDEYNGKAVAYSVRDAAKWLKG